MKFKLSTNLLWARLFPAAVLLILGGLLADGAQGQESFRWPLDRTTRYLTSNFMEYRSGRFHAGIDLKTNSTTGYAVRAVEDGYILRVRATPAAYGRVVYMQGNSGRTYVFAHLARFNDALRARVESVRAKSGKYRVSLEYPADQIKVKRGDILGLSGESGTAGPHLHFEVRDSRQRPLNPHGQGFSVADTLAPVFHNLRAIPVDQFSTLAGGEVAQVLRRREDSSLAAGLRGTLPVLRISGPVAFSAKIVDAADLKGHKLEPYLLQVSLDGKVVYSCRNDSYAFGQNSLQRLEWLHIPAQPGYPAIREHWLHRRPENTLEGRSGQLWFLGEAGQGLTPGEHTLEISAADYAGNQSRITLPLLVTAAAASSTGKGVKNSSSVVDGVSWLPQPVQVPVRLDSTGVVTHWLTPFGSRQEPDSGSWPTLVALDPGRGDPVLAPTLVALVPALQTSAQAAAARKQGLHPVGEYIACLTADWPIDAAVPLAIPFTGPVPAKALAYRWASGKWRQQGNLLPATAKKGVRLVISQPGIYGFFLDETPPLLENPGAAVVIRPDERLQVHGVTMPRWQVLALSVKDAGCGVAAETIHTFLDGRPIIPEPDLPRDRILVTLPDEVVPGAYTLLVEASDEVGNTVSQEITIEVIPK